MHLNHEFTVIAPSHTAPHLHHLFISLVCVPSHILVLLMTELQTRNPERINQILHAVVRGCTPTTPRDGADIRNEDSEMQMQMQMQT